MEGPRDRPCRGGNADESNRGGNADESNRGGNAVAGGEEPAKSGIVFALPLLAALATGAARRRGRLRGGDPDL